MMASKVMCATPFGETTTAAITMVPRRLPSFGRPGFRLIWSRRNVLIGLLSMQLLLLLTLQYFSFKYAGEESPLDHTKTTLLKPFFKLTCGSANHDAVLDRPFLRAQCHAQRPKLFMISARSLPERMESWDSWHQLDPSDQVHVIDTKQLSTELQVRVEMECPGSHAWAYRLFLIYQHVFAQLLQEFPHDPAFVLLEDDAILTDAPGLFREICYAQQQQYAFYSLYKASQQTACLYHSGTVAFFITRDMMQHIIQVPRATSCRLPIDIYLATNGPWYATQETIVLHKSKRKES